MDIRNYLKQSHLYDVLVVNSFVSIKRRLLLKKISGNIIFYTLIIMVLYYLIKDTSKFKIYHDFADFLVPRLIGLFILNVGIFGIAKLIDLYLSSQYYFEHIVLNQYSPEELYTLSAGKVLYSGRKTDILHGFFESRIGKRVLTRLGVTKKEVSDFISSQKPVYEENIPKQKDNILKLKDIVIHLYENNKNFTEFLNKKGISKEVLLGALSWVIFEIESREYKSEWWRPEALARIPGIAKDWSFGRTFLLDKYSREIMLDEQVSSNYFVISDRENEISQIENILSKSNETNVLLIGEPGQEKIQVIWSLCRQIKSKNIAATLKNKRPILLIVNILVSSCREKSFFENQFIKILDEVIKAGNVLLVIDNFPLLISTATQLGSDISSLIEPFLTGSGVQIIAISNTAEYHQVIEPNKVLMSGLEIVKINPLTTEENAKIISGSALEIEDLYDITFTFQAIKELAESAEYYFPEGVSSDKAVDLLNEIAPWAKRKGIINIDKNEVLEYIEQKTNIPTSGRISEKEKDKLLNMENLIGQRVIGQKEAVTGVSNAIRRARSGVRNPNKPIGSFLFLGPTGVGKTETAKALAEVFFGSEENMMRLDMSEYQTDDAMERLIGSFKENKPGIFSSMLRDKQYGVVLLDEFEKTNKEVQNLFLQILDEGMFSDTNGKKVSTKNIIFVATSNAGSETIFKMIEEGKNPEDAKEEILGNIISKGLFKPELINRFDGTIIFHPLNEGQLKQIAKLMIKKVAKRLIEKGIELKTNDSLVDYIVKNGSNAVFGARPMNRFIQDSVEEKISVLIIKNELKTGDSLEFKIEENELLPVIN
ncbi:MAG: ATP-dependent Clp protease ATP-binding subunit [Candidatus Paceibacterota bacterium]|jgi:ATP-dependent Clp protease ATP-binding subunit ClpC